jgi:EAL domain-containing protein (putative c-di-GMP-specific phosphodiesterase class I)
MQLQPTFQTLSQHNRHNHSDLLQQLSEARSENPAAEPQAARCLRWHLAGAQKLLSYNFEYAFALQPNPTLHFSEALFSLKDERGQRLPSPVVLRTLQTYAPQRRLDSRFRFWLGFHAATDFFADPTHGCTHLSINIPAYAAASPFFKARFEQALTLFEAAHPGKGLILEMLEHQPWTDAQRQTMQALKARKVGWAVDDYGAADGHHSPRSLQLAAEYTGTPPTLIKLDGGLLTACLTMQNFAPLCERVHEVDAHVPLGLLVLEWVQNAGQVAQIYNALNRAGCRTKIGYVQSHGFTPSEQSMAIKAINPL